MMAKQQRDSSLPRSRPETNSVARLGCEKDQCGQPPSTYAERGSVTLQMALPDARKLRFCSKGCAGRWLAREELSESRPR